MDVSSFHRLGSLTEGWYLVVVICKHPCHTRAIISKETCTFENTISAKSKRLSVVKLNHMEAKLQASSPWVLLTIWNIEWVDLFNTDMMISTYSELANLINWLQSCRGQNIGGSSNGTPNWRMLGAYVIIRAFWVNVQSTRHTWLLEAAGPGSVSSNKVTSQIGPPAK